MSKQATSIRIRPDLKEALERRAREAGLPAAALYERYLDEGLRRADHPLIVFRDGAGGRRAALAGTRLDVGQVIDSLLAAKGKGDAALQETAEYLSIPEGHVRASLSYYAQYKDEVDTWRSMVAEMAEREREAWRREQAVLA